MKKFEIIEHTADIGIRVFGEDTNGLFLSASSALFSLLMDYKPNPVIKKIIKLQAQNLEELLVSWLNELISLVFTYGYLFSSFEIKVNNEDGINKLQAVVRGEQLNDISSKINMEIKAATYHNLKIVKNNKYYVVEVIFDV